MLFDKKARKKNICTYMYYIIRNCMLDYLLFLSNAENTYVQRISNYAMQLYMFYLQKNTVTSYPNTHVVMYMIIMIILWCMVYSYIYKKNMIISWDNMFKILCFLFVVCFVSLKKNENAKNWQHTKMSLLLSFVLLSGYD